mgnify:CR=1 FL=1
MESEQRTRRLLIKEAVRRSFASRSQQAGTLLAILRTASTLEQLQLLGRILTTFRTY